MQYTNELPRCRDIVIFWKKYDIRHIDVSYCDLTELDVVMWAAGQLGGISYLQQILSQNKPK